jgi:uncharacterized membrane protein
MELLNAANVVTAVVVLLMIGCLVKLFTGDIGSNKTFYIIALIILGIGLYLWRSDFAAEFISDIFGVVK